MPEVVRSPEIRQRRDFGLLIDTRGLQILVEVGVDRGHFARRLLARSHAYMLYAVDTWEPYPEMTWDRDGDYRQAVQLLAPFGERARVLRCPSDLAARLISARGPIDFVYIDAAHDHLSVRDDLDAWWPKVSPIGILAGHDYDADHGGVIDEVNRLADREGRTVYLTAEAGAAPSWYVYKTPPETLVECLYNDRED